MLLACVEICTSHPLALAQAATPLTTVNTCPLLHTAGTPVGTAHPSTRVFLSAHQVTKFHCVGVAGNVKASCFPLQVVLSVAVTNLFVVVLSEMSSASNTTAPVLEFTEVTVSVGVNNSFQLAAVEYGSALST